MNIFMCVLRVRIMNDLRKLQLAELYMLKDIANICEANGIKYYITAGTLLGAVRHKGFIPWDDDLDITMYRKDLQKLTSLLRSEYKEKYFVQSFDTDKNYTRYITKIRLNGTKQVEEIYENDDINHGIYIDIFPLDHTTKSGGIGLAIRGKILRLLFAYKTTKHTKSWKTSKFKQIVINILKPITYLIPDSLINKAFDYCCSKTDVEGAKYTTSFASHYLWNKQMFPNEVYGEGVKIVFEDGKFIAPTKYLILLEQLYGPNYMDIPDEHLRDSGHILQKIDLGEYDKIILS